MCGPAQWMTMEHSVPVMRYRQPLQFEPIVQPRSVNNQPATPLRIHRCGTPTLRAGQVGWHSCLGARTLRGLSVLANCAVLLRFSASSHRVILPDQSGSNSLRINAEPELQRKCSPYKALSGFGSNIVPSTGNATVAPSGPFVTPTLATPRTCRHLHSAMRHALRRLDWQDQDSSTWISVCVVASLCTLRVYGLASKPIYTT